MSHADRHLTAREVRELVRRELPVEEAARLGRHLHLCPECWDLAERTDPKRFPAFALAFGLRKPKGSSLELSHHEGWLEEAAEAQKHMAKLQRKLQPLPPGRRRLLLRNLDSAPLPCKFLTITRICKQLFLSNPNEAIDLAVVGLELLAEKWSELPSQASVSFAASLLAHYGNGLRIVGDLRHAEQVLREAERLSADAGDPLDRAWACRYLGYALADRRRYEEALQFARAARRTFEAVHDTRLTLETQVVEAKFLSEAEKHEESVRLLKSIEVPVAEGGYLTLELSVKEWLAFNYLHLGTPFLGWRLIPGIKQIAKVVGGIAIIKANWLEALILEAVGDLPAADRLLRRVCSDFGTDYPYDHAVAALDRMRILIRQGSLGKASALLRDLIPLVKGARLHSQAVRALRLLAEQGIEAPVIRAIQDFLGKLRRDPSYTLEDANLPC